MSEELRASAVAASVRRPLYILVAWAVALLLLVLVVTVAGTVAWLLLANADALAPPDRRWPRLTNVAIVAIPIAAVVLGALLTRLGGGLTFQSQQRMNRRVSLLFLVALVGLLTVLGEVVAVSVTFDAYAGMIGAGVAAVAGLGAAAFAHLKGVDAVLASAGARHADPAREPVLLNVVNELSIAADIPPPRVYVIEDGSLNAMAVGTGPGNHAIAVTRGMLERFDREQLQGVVAHELAHLRNLDSRYGVYVAMLVGLVALVTDGFLRTVVRAWQEGSFLQGGDDDSGIAGFVAGIAFGLFLLLVASVLRLLAPLAALLVQAAVSRQREFLADATSVELTRNPVALARAVRALGEDRDPLDSANRGSQHLWFTSPVRDGDDVGWHLLATHPTLDARIDRLAELFPAGVANALEERAVELAEPALEAVPAAGPATPEG